MGIARTLRRQFPQQTGWLLYTLHYRRAMALTDRTWGLVCPYGIGDTYLVCALARGLLHRRGGDKVVLLTRAWHQEMAALFPDDITRSVLLQEAHLRTFQALRYRRPLQPGEPVVAHPWSHATQPGIPDHLAPRLSLLDRYRHLFQLPQDTPLTRPHIPQAAYDSARTRMHAVGLPEGRTVLLAPEAVSLDMLPHAFWQHLVRTLRKAGWAVAMNRPGRGPAMVLEGVVPLSFPLQEAIPLAELAGWVISSRSGLCDLLSSADCRFSVLYPKSNRPWSPLQEFGLIGMGLSDRVEEFEIAPGDDDSETARRILG